ncbi:hypothetical protein Tco_0270443 [Tanacetum coccineum]
MKVEESLNVTFVESAPPTKLSSLTNDDVGEEQAIENQVKLDNNIENETLKDDVAQAKRLFGNEKVWVEMHRGIAWGKVENLNTQSSTQVLPSFEEFTPPMTYSEEAEETIGIPMETSSNRRVPFSQRNNPPQNPRIVYLPILNINYFRYFLDILRNYNPMDDEPMWDADHVVALTPGSAITIHEIANEFAIKGNHLTLVKGNQFDGRTKTDPHKHIHEFLGICDMFKYRDTENEAVRLMMFPLSLTGEAKTWLDEFNE